MPERGIILKLPTGTPAPTGYNYVRSLRHVDVYKKRNVVTKEVMDDLISLFGTMGLPEKEQEVILQKTSINAVNDLSSALSKLEMRGGLSKTRRNKKTSQYTRRHRRSSRHSSRRTSRK